LKTYSHISRIWPSKGSSESLLRRKASTFSRLNGSEKLSEKRKYSVIEALERMRDGNYALM
jgi:hypothetical protein